MKKSATYENWRIEILDNGTVDVYENEKAISKYSRKKILMDIVKANKIDIKKFDTDKIGRLLINFLHKEDVIREIHTVIDAIIRTIEYESSETIDTPSDFSYNQQRAIINKVFTLTSKEYNKAMIMLRLVVIDSLYSTNAQYSYFSIEEMADNIIKLGDENNATEYFYNLVKNGDGEDRKKLFSTSYGIRKNLSKGSRQMSLMSKYAYYALLQDRTRYPLGFPIYDSLAVEMYPKVCELLCINNFSLKKLNNASLSIEEYIKSLNILRVAIFGKKNDNLLYNKYQQYDLLDAYLWRMGKLNNGNYYLLFDKKDYMRFIKNINLDKENDDIIKLYSCYLNVISDNKIDVDFNKLVRNLCAETKRTTNQILKYIKNKSTIERMIEHWKKYYA